MTTTQILTSYDTSGKVKPAQNLTTGELKTMNKKEKIYYLMGLKDAINELKLEIKASKEDMSGEALIAYQYAIMSGILSIKCLIEAVKNNI